MTHWHWGDDIDVIFSCKLMLGPWLSLLDQSPSQIGLFEEEWNHPDTLTEKTKLLHNTEIPTQPWKTGLPADNHEHAPKHPASLERMKRLARRMFPKAVGQDDLLPTHSDPCQELMFFALMREWLERGSITERFLRTAIRKNYLRSDAFALLDRLPVAPAGALSLLTQRRTRPRIHRTASHQMINITAHGRSSRIRSAARHASALIGSLVLPETRVGMIEPSATRKPDTPRTRSRSSRTAIASCPILQIPEKCEPGPRAGDRHR